jgi:hypothetical protein
MQVIDDKSGITIAAVNSAPSDERDPDAGPPAGLR